MTDARRDLTRVLRERAPRVYRAGRRAWLIARDRYGRAAGETRGVSWLIVLTLPNSGSTALAQALMTSPRAVALNRYNEGEILWGPYRDVCWDQRRTPDFAAARGVWMQTLRQARGRRRDVVVVEKSPSHILRFRDLRGHFPDMPMRAATLSREPYAISASWMSRYSRERIAKYLAPHRAADLMDDRLWVETIGEIVGEYMEALADLVEEADLTLSYEGVTADPAGAGEAIVAAAPELERIDMGAAVAVKDYDAQPLQNMNARQAGRLSADHRAALARGMRRRDRGIRRLGYSVNWPYGDVARRRARHAAHVGEAAAHG